MITGKTILILGGSGSLGHNLTKRYLQDNEVYIFSRGENTQWLMKQHFNNNPKLHFYVGDIRDKERVDTCLFRCKPHIIIIAAALKHIDICEKNTNECINTNIEGVRNVINTITTRAMTNSIPFLETVLFVSTDKACAPVNTYGMCKSVSERVMVEKTEFLESPIFINVRYGNVLMSRGSLIPLFKSIGEDPAKKEFCVTDDEMTRYFMSLDDSVDLIDFSINNGESGDTIIPKNIKCYRILDIAKHFSKKYNKPIRFTGIRPGEKIHEMLVSFTESLRTTEKEDYYIIKPSYKKVETSVIFPDGNFNSSLNISDIDGKLAEFINT